MISDPQEYVNDMARKRGYVLGYHKVLAKKDFSGSPDYSVG